MSQRVAASGHGPHGDLAARRVRRATTICSLGFRRSPRAVSSCTEPLPGSTRPSSRTDVEIFGVTATVDHLLTDQLMVRGEVRWDTISKDSGANARRVLPWQHRLRSDRLRPEGRPDHPRRRGHLQLQQVRRRVTTSPSRSRSRRGARPQGPRPFPFPGRDRPGARPTWTIRSPNAPGEGTPQARPPIAVHGSSECRAAAGTSLAHPFSSA